VTELDRARDGEGTPVSPTKPSRQGPQQKHQQRRRLGFLETCAMRDETRAGLESAKREIAAGRPDDGFKRADGPSHAARQGA